MLVIYDFEVMKSFWCMVAHNPLTNKTVKVVNDPNLLAEFYEENKESIWVGYNNIHFDQYLLHGILSGLDPYKISQWIIIEGKPGWTFSNLINQYSTIEYDCMRDETKSLKLLEGFMGSNIQESSIDFNIQRELTESEIEEMLFYCENDAKQTLLVFQQHQSDFWAKLKLIKMFPRELNLRDLKLTGTQMASRLLGAIPTKRDDEWEIELNANIRLNKYLHVLEWYKNPNNRNYNLSYEVPVGGCNECKCSFGWGGLHGSTQSFIGEGIYIMADIQSYYPSLMINFNYISRNIKDDNLYKEIYDKRIQYKLDGNPLQESLKLILNASFGATKFQGNHMYDPRQANMICVNGQLIILDCVEKIENRIQLLQINTDGILFEIKNLQELEEVKRIIGEWEQRFNLVMDYKVYDRLWQKDVNNYILMDSQTGKIKCKGKWFKPKTPLDNDIPILNKALVDYLTKDISIEDTINSCDDLIQFQQVVRLTAKFDGIKYGGEIMRGRTFRIFASTNILHGQIYKMKKGRPHRFADTPSKCFIDNGDITNKKIPPYLDKNHYIQMAKERLKKAFNL